MPIPFSSRLLPSVDVIVRLVGEEAVLLDLKTERYLGLDAVSVRFWQVITDGKSLEDAHQALLSEFEVEPERLRADLEEFAQELVNLGLAEQRNQ